MDYQCLQQTTHPACPSYPCHQESLFQCFSASWLRTLVHPPRTPDPWTRQRWGREAAWRPLHLSHKISEETGCCHLSWRGCVSCQSWLWTWSALSHVSLLAGRLLPHHLIVSDRLAMSWRPDVGVTVWELRQIVRNTVRVLLVVTWYNEIKDSDT